MTAIIEHRDDIGAFDIDLRADTPATITQQMRVPRSLYGPVAGTKGFAVVVVLNEWQPLEDHPPPADPETIHSLMGAARYSGVLRKVSNAGRRLSGHGPLGLLMDPDGAGSWATDFVDVTVSGADSSVIIDHLIDGGNLNITAGGFRTLEQSQLRLGTITTETTDWPIPGQEMQDYLALIRKISDRVGFRWKVDPQFRFHWGPEATLWPGQPRVIIGNDLPADSDPAWPSVHAGISDWGETTEGYHYRVEADGIGVYGPSISSPAPGGPRYWSGATGRPIQSAIELPYDTNPLETYTTWKFRADLTAAAAALNRWSASVQGELVNGDHIVVQPGESVFLWDQALGIDDETISAPVVFGGHPIRPVPVPVLASRWRLSEGMGLYLLWSEEGAQQQALDLTPYAVLAKTRELDLELGAPRPTL